MKIGIISFSSAGEKLAKRLESGLKAVYKEAEINNVCKSEYACSKLEISHDLWTKQRFNDSDAIIFIGACGIAVRSISPYVKSKKTDPAIVVIDDCGKFSIPLLSGHLGGANELAKLAAEISGATAAVTTATDNHGKLSPDLFAKKNNCEIGSFVKAKELAAWLLEENTCAIYSEFDMDTAKIPSEVKLINTADVSKPEISKGIYISVCDGEIPKSQKQVEGNETCDWLKLIPRAAYVGIGCKRGTNAEAIQEAFEDALKRCNLDRRAVAAICSCDIKKNETGLVEFCRNNKLKFITFSSDELMSMEGDFTPSEFVKSVTGTDNVCERSAAAGCIKAADDDIDNDKSEYEIILRKLCSNGVTCAVAVRRWRISFE